MQIRAYQASDEAAVIALWQRCGLTRPWNDPKKAEQLLIERGCPKINLLVRAGNAQVIDFYRRLGYGPDKGIKS